MNNGYLAVENMLFTAVMLLYFASMLLFFLFFAMQKEKLAAVAAVLQTIGLVLYTAALIVRGIGAGRLPMTNQYEFATSFAWGLSLVCLYFIYRHKFRVLGTFATPVIFLVIGFHVSTAIIGYGAFGVSFAVSLIYLIREKLPSSAFLSKHVPGSEKLDMLSYRAASLGFLFLTFTIITGSIWAERAWGSYWSWDPKETWSLVTWIIYAIYLHLRIRRGWKDRSAAIFAVIGFICVIFTYIGVNTLLPGIHSYA